MTTTRSYVSLCTRRVRTKRCAIVLCAAGFSVDRAHGVMFSELLSSSSDDGAGVITVGALNDDAANSALLFTGTLISWRFERLLADGIEALPLELHADAQLPQEILTMLGLYFLRWDALDGNLQRMLLWDAGYVLSSDGRLTKMYTRCGLTMDDIVLDKSEYEQLGCLSTSCGDLSGGSNLLRSSESAMDCPDSMISQVVKCATTDEVRVVSSASFWAQEENNTDIPQPLIYRHSSRTYSIQLQTGEPSAASQSTLSDKCPTHSNLIIPCTTYESIPRGVWCAPKSTRRLPGVLRSIAGKRQQSTDALSAGASGNDESISTALWIVGTLLAVVVAIVFVITRHHMRKMQQHASALLSEKQSEVDAGQNNSSASDYFLSRRLGNTNNGSVLSLHESALNGFSSRSQCNNMLAKSASYTDIICTSEIMMEFQCDPVIIEKRVPVMDLKYEKVICQGASGEIHIGKLNGDYEVAVKRLMRIKMNDPKEIEKFAREIQLHATLQHPNIVSFVGVAWNSFQNLAMVMEHKAGGDLLQALRRKTGKRWTWGAEKLQIAFGIVKALAYLHGLSKPVIHRDLKSRNILMDANTLEPSLCDFGSSCSVDNLSVDFVSTDPAGTILWSAPEVIKAQDYSEKADIYSFGVVLTEIDTCKLPYKEEKDSSGRPVQAIRIARMVVDGEIQPKLTPECPTLIRKIAQACLQHDPDRRPSARELLLYLRDPGRYSFEWDCEVDDSAIGSDAEWEMKRGSLFCL
ncbi:Serine/threonine protein kinase, partial [Globisporangium splendens]